MPKIAIVGSGISGLTCGHLLSSENDVHLFEANDSLGGHTATVEVEVASGKYLIDTGFVAFNDWAYPNFSELLRQLKVPSKASNISLGVKNEVSGLEYNGSDLNALFAQRSNILRPSFYKMLRDIWRFNREPLEASVQSFGQNLGQSLGEFLKQGKYSSDFVRDYLLPMGAAMWSVNEAQLLAFPVRFSERLFKDHGMLSPSFGDDRPIWRVVQNGSSSYIGPMIRRFQDRIRLMTSVQSLKKTTKGISLELSNGENFEADQVILACHSDQALRILKESPEFAEHRELLCAFAYQSNDVVLHTDESVLPRRKLAWGAWNYLVPSEPRSRPSVTYNMNVLQGLKAAETFCVSLNMNDRIDSSKVLRRFIYDHPVYTAQSVKAQENWGAVSGRNGVHLAGAYWGYGFHEDGVNSALNLCKAFGVKLGGRS